MLRLRTIKAAYKEIKEADPGTAITLYFIQNLVANREIPSLLYNKRHYISKDDLDVFFRKVECYLADPAKEKAEETDEMQEIDDDDMDLFE